MAELEQQRIKKMDGDKQVRTKIKIYPRANIEFKCNFCDGGCSEIQVGYNGACRDEIIHNNIEIEKRTRCGSEDSPCNQYLNEEINRSELYDICNSGGFVYYESQMFRIGKHLLVSFRRVRKRVNL